MSNEGIKDNETGHMEKIRIIWSTGQGVPDIWPKIFQYLSNPQDMVNLYFACPHYFHSLLTSDQHSILFPPVLKVLFENKFLPRLEILKCRLLSTQVKSQIEDFGNPCFENLDGPEHDIYDPTHNELRCWRVPKFIPRKITDYDLVHTGISIDGLRTLPRVIMCTVYDKCTSECRLQQNTGTFQTLLSRIGPFDHIIFVWVMEDSATAYTILQQLLSVNPKLRSLEVRIIGGPPCVNDSDLEQLFQTAPLPDLNLVKFSARVTRRSKNIQVFKRNAEHKILKALLTKYLPRIEKLELGFFFGGMDSLLNEYFHKLIPTCQNLKQISLPYLGDRVFFEWPATIESVTMNMNFCRKSHRVLDLCRALHSGFGNAKNVTALVIRLTDEDMDPDNLWRPKTGTLHVQSNEKLELPSIKIMWIYSTIDSFNSIDFIAGLSKTLKQLTINFERNVPTEKLTNKRVSGGIQFIGYWNKMYESNIWQVMPQLEILTIRFKDRTSDNIPWQYWEYSRKQLTQGGSLKK